MWKALPWCQLFCAVVRRGLASVIENIEEKPRRTLPDLGPPPLAGFDDAFRERAPHRADRCPLMGEERKT